MTPKEFVKRFYSFASMTQGRTGISAIVVLAQAALESAWGEVAPGNMFFGVKDTDGVNGNEQLLTTYEYSRRADMKFTNLLKIEPVMLHGVKYFRYTIKAYFRKYNSPEESFTDHAEFFQKNGVYAEALKLKDDPYKFIDAIAPIYATGPDYAEILKSIARTIQKELPRSL